MEEKNNDKKTTCDIIIDYLALVVGFAIIIAMAGYMASIIVPILGLL